MTSNSRRIHAVAGIVGHRLGERRRDGLPDPSLAPASKALIDRHPLTVLLGNVAPGRAGSDAPENAIDDQAVIGSGTALAPSLRRQQILQ